MFSLPGTVLGPIDDDGNELNKKVLTIFELGIFFKGTLHAYSNFILQQLQSKDIYTYVSWEGHTVQGTKYPDNFLFKGLSIICMMRKKEFT